MRVRGPQRDDGVEVGDVPALFQHVHVDDDLDWVVCVLHLQQSLDHQVLLRAGPAGVHLDGLVAIAALEERLRLDVREHLAGVRRVPGDDQQDRLDDRLTGLARVGGELDLHGLVKRHAVFELQLLDGVSRHRGGVEVPPRHHGRLLHEAVGNRPSQWVVEDDVPEGGGRALAPALHERRGGHFEAENRLQLVDGANPRRRAVAMRFVHDEDEVRKRRQVVEVALADLRQALDPGRLPATHLAVDLRDVEDVHLARRRLFQQRPGQRLVVVAGDDRRGIRRELRDALEDVLRGVRSEVGDQLVVDGEVRRQHEEVPDGVRGVQVADERPHQPCLADAGGQREAEGREVALEVRDLRKLGADGRQCGGDIRAPPWRHELAEAVQDLQRLALRMAQAQAIGDGGDLAMHQVC